MYPTCKISKNCMHVKLVVVQNSGKMAHLAQPTTGTSFGNFIYTIIVCNDTLFIKFQVLKLILVQKIRNSPVML